MNKKREQKTQKSFSVDYETPVSSGLLVFDRTDGVRKQDKAEGGRSAEAPENTIPYSVSENDTLASLAVQFGSDLAELKRINRLISSKLYTGQVLHVPTAGYKSRIEVKIGKPAESKDTGEQPKKETKYSAQRRFTAPIIQAYNFIEKKVDRKGRKDKRKNSGPKEAQSVDTFTLQASYLIGDKRGEGVEGIISITPEQFLFKPNRPSTEAERKIWEMVNYKMCLGDLLRSAKFYQVNPINLDRVDTNTYLNALMQESRDLDNVSEGTPSHHSRDSSVGSRGSMGITFSVKSAHDATSLPHTSTPHPQALDVSQLSSEVSRDSSYQISTSSNSTALDPRDQSGGKSGENENKTCDTVDKVHFIPVDAADTAAVAEVTYLRVKLGQGEKPTVSSLIQSTFGALLMRPVTGKDLQSQSQSWTRHCFAIPIERTEDLKKFLTRYYPDQLYNEASDQKEKLERKISEDKRILRRNLSVLDVCRLPLPQMSDPSELLTEVQIRILCEHLLVSADCRPWLLAYTTDKHGFSLKTLYRLCSQLNSASLLLVQDLNDQVFGAMLPCTLRLCEGYYGTGESFLFKFHPIFKKYGWVGKNDYFVSGTSASLSIGAGKGQFGLWIDDDLRRGRTEKCETYDNDPLSENSDFFIKAIEVWLFPLSL